LTIAIDSSCEQVFYRIARSRCFGTP
jgi:hypothetical protein